MMRCSICGEHSGRIKKCIKCYKRVCEMCSPTPNICLDCYITSNATSNVLEYNVEKERCVN